MLFLINLTSHPSQVPPLDSIKILLFTAHSLWGQLLFTYITNFKDNIRVTINDDTNEDLESALNVALTTNSDLILVASPGYVGAELSFVQALHKAGCHTPILMLISHYIMPTLESLMKVNIQGIITTQAKPGELEKSIHEILKHQPGSLKQQYIRAARFLTHQPEQDNLTIHERKLINLVAADLTDQDIAECLGINLRTVNNQLHLIYGKLGVKGRAGAVSYCFVRGIITPYSVLSARMLSAE